MEDDTKHDPLDQYRDENDMEAIMVERAADADETRAADAFLGVDNETAREANAATAVTDEEARMEELEEELDEEVEGTPLEAGDERKHKNRESTSEKAKKAAATGGRQSTSEKAKISQAEKQRQMDPLRLRGKKYRAVVSQVEKNTVYSLTDAIELVKKTATASFDSAVEMHVKVKGEAVRGTVVLPGGSGKTRKVAVATDDVIEAISNGKLEFDVLLATPAQMPKLAKFAKVLGPKGLMPSPKAGTVTDDIERVMAEIGGGRVEYRADKTGVVHLSIGRVSFASEKLAENFRAIEQALLQAKVQSASLASTMGPGVKVALTK